MGLKRAQCRSPPQGAWGGQWQQQPPPPHQQPSGFYVLQLPQGGFPHQEFPPTPQFVSAPQLVPASQRSLVPLQTRGHKQQLHVHTDMQQPQEVCWLQIMNKGSESSLVPRPSTPPVFDSSQYAKMAEKAWGIFTHDLRHKRHMSSHIFSTVKSCTRPILCSVLATKMGQVPTESYTECVRHTQTTSHDSKWLLNDKCPAMTQSSRGAKRWHYFKFHPLYHSYPSVVLL